ncbi:hypothetical protein [Edwardsiella tarda]|uniref:hypothetical protein n=1 Tax=Edwardsiella tarda TaxID=636 RepID=UPI00068F1559|nr:hypothetical protein [Edwardsiella tarda]
MLRMNLPAVVLLVASGWMVRDWYQYSLDAKAQEVTKQHIQRESNIAKIVEQKLQELRANEKTTIKEIQTIIERPVYSRDCFDHDGLQAINNAATGNTRKPIK